MPYSEQGMKVGRSVAIIGIILTGIAGITGLILLSVTHTNDATTVGQIIVFAGTIVAALVAYLKGAESVEEARINRQIGIDNAARLDEVHAQVDSGKATTKTTAKLAENAYGRRASDGPPAKP